MGTPPDPKMIVRSGYDSASRRYRSDDDSPEVYAAWIAQLDEATPPSGRLLDLGCGCGVPVARELSLIGVDVTGVDISEVQVARARGLVPGATFIVADVSDVRFRPASFDTVCCFYTLIHIPQDEQRQLIVRIANWLKPGGLFLATVGHTAWTGEEAGWLGGSAPMWWSHPGQATYRDWIESANLKIHDQQFIPDGTSGHTLFAATKAPSTITRASATGSADRPQL